MFSSMNLEWTFTYNLLLLCTAHSIIRHFPFCKSSGSFQSSAMVEVLQKQMEQLKNLHIPHFYLSCPTETFFTDRVAMRVSFFLSLIKFFYEIFYRTHTLFPDVNIFPSIIHSITLGISNLPCSHKSRSILSVLNDYVIGACSFQ